MGENSDSEGEPFPSLTSVRSDFDKLCEDEGGPVGLIEGIGEDSLSAACERVPFEDIAPLLAELHIEHDLQRRHWPWIAITVRLCKFPSEDELKPSEIRRLLERIESSATSLFDTLAELNRMRLVRREIRDSLRTDHLGGLWALIGQALADLPSDRIVQDDLAQMGVARTSRIWRQQLYDLAKAMPGIMSQVSDDALKLSKPSEIPALPTLVRRLSTIWISMTGRKPSARGHLVCGAEVDSPFTRFVKGVAILAGMSVPSQGQIRTALKPAT